MDLDHLLSPRHILVLLVVYFVGCYPFAFIFRRAGYSGWLSLLMLIPLVNIGLLWWLAFAKWNVQTQAK